MGKSSAQTCSARRSAGGSIPLASCGGCVRLPAGRQAARVASSPQLHSIRDQQPRAAQQHSWLQRLRLCGGPQKPFVLFVEREFILLEFSVCSCGVSLVSLS